MSSFMGYMPADTVLYIKSSVWVELECALQGALYLQPWEAQPASQLGET